MKSISVAAYREIISASSGATGKAGRRHRRNRPEENLQRDCIAWAEAHLHQYPDLAFMFHPANGGGRSAAEAGIFKATGVRAGVPDLMLPVISPAGGGPCGLALELKSPKGVLSRHQRSWLERLSRAGYLVAIIRTLDHFILCVKAWHGQARVTISADFEIVEPIPGAGTSRHG